MCAKYYKNPTMLSWVTAKNVGDVFFETHCMSPLSYHYIYPWHLYWEISSRKFPWRKLPTSQKHFPMKISWWSLPLGTCCNLSAFSRHWYWQFSLVKQLWSCGVSGAVLAGLCRCWLFMETRMKTDQSWKWKQWGIPTSACVKRD